MWVPGFLQPSKVSPLMLWGKLPGRGDFVQHNLKHAQSEALQAWISRHLHTEQHAIAMPSASATPAARRRCAEDARWCHLTPVDLVDPRAPTPASPAQTWHTETIRSGAGHTGLPWCFVLPPGTLPFAKKKYVIGVWMTSSDKIGRIYPLVMAQTASSRWITQYFAGHAAQPCDWLFAAARAMAHAVYAEETEKDRPGTQPADYFAALVAQLEQLWIGYQPLCRGLAGSFKRVPDRHSHQQCIPAPHQEDPIGRLHGVRYLPWADWPQRLTDGAAGHAAFWQQDVHGRFVGAAERIQDVI